MQLKTLSLAGAVMLALPGFAWAHHSHAMYDPDRRITAEATVTDFVWANPHVWVYVAIVDENGEAKDWLLESGSPNGLARNGWTRDAIKVGDVVTVTFGPMRDGSNGGLLGTVKLPDGRTVSSAALDNNLGTDEIPGLFPATGR